MPKKYAAFDMPIYLEVSVLDYFVEVFNKINDNTGMYHLDITFVGSIFLKREQ
jgi:hypothetical protein